MALIFYLSHQAVLPGSEVIWLDVVFKKMAHFSIYAGLFLTWWWTFSKIEKKQGRTLAYKWWLIPLFCLVFAISDEFHQYFITGRNARLYDVWVDSLGWMTAWFWAYRYI